MKKITFLMIAVMLSVGASKAQDFFVNGVGYVSGGVDGGLKAWGPAVGFKGDMVIPASVTNNGTTYNVTEVRAYFSNKNIDKAVVRSLTVSEGIKTFTVGENGSFDTQTNVDGAGDSIHSLVLPSTITLKAFTDYTFRGHPLLKNFTIKLTTPPTATPRVFFNCNNFDTIRVHIPAGTKADYIAAGWTTDNLGGNDDPSYGTREILLVEDALSALNTVSASTISVRALSGNSFAVAGIDGKADVAIYELSGKRVATFTQVVNNDVLTNSDLKAGLYIVKLNNGANSTAAKLVFN